MSDTEPVTFHYYLIGTSNNKQGHTIQLYIQSCAAIIIQCLQVVSFEMSVQLHAN